MPAPLRRLAEDLCTRMTVIRLPGGGLLLHSPVEADAETRRAVTALGPVRAIAAPRAALDRVLAWDFDRVTLTHGDVLESGGRGREALRRAYAWL